MENAIGLICFILMIAAQIAAVVAVHQSERHSRADERTKRRAPVHGLPDAI